MYTFKSPAKINLFLHITGQRDNGYHDLQTLFQFLDFCDELQFELRDDGKIVLADNIVDVAPEDNLIVKAARALQQRLPETKGVTIHLHKRIPMGAGLAGGSSNAATTLLVLNRLWELHLSEAELIAIGAQLGADIPVFIKGVACWAEGIGEELYPADIPEQWYLLVIPPCHVPTAKIFSEKQLTRNTPAIRIPASWPLGTSRNDCEPVARNLYPDIDFAIRWLEKFAPTRMTGTGAAIFAAFSSQQDAEKVRAQLPEQLTGHVVKGMNQSPLLQ